MLERRLMGIVALVMFVLLGACASGGSVIAPSPDAAWFGSSLVGDEGEQVAGGEPPELAPAQTADPVPNPSAESGKLVVYTEPGEIPRLMVAGDGERQKLPLEHTHVKATLTGTVAEVEVTQTYDNPHDEPIEAVYVFPLPENSAVFHMRMVIGDRSVVSRIMERGEARRTYESARREGYTAALLEQERPNVFTQSVANIAPREKIDVVVRYVQDLTYDAGQYEFVFPMVVGPRFVPDTVAVPDASRISPPIVGKGQRTGHDISLELVASAGTAVEHYEVPTHEVVARRPADGTLRLTLAEKESLPNRDFVLRYQAVGERPRATLLTSGGDHGYFTLLVHPPRLDVNELVGRREIVFVVDVSGSMSGVPLGLCQTAMRDALSRLRPVDTFNVITFAGSTGKAFDAARPANRTNVREALDYIDAMRAGGGTYMMNAIDAALTPDVGDGRHRYVFFLTDGLVGNEDQILSSTSRFVQTLEGRGMRARVFGFGVGSSVNRALLDGLARQGRGLTVYASNREHPARAVNQFYRYIDRSVLRDVRIDWAGFAVDEVLPSELPDLFASHPMIVHGRYRGQPDGKNIQIRGVSSEGAVLMPVSVVAPGADAAPRAVLGTLWARSKVGELESALWENPHEPAAKRAITELGIRHHLVTRFTSLVAVDRSRRVGDGEPERIVQPVEAPEGIDMEMVRPQAAYGPPAMEAADVKGCFCRAAGGPAGRSMGAAWAAVLLGLLAFGRRRLRATRASDRTARVGRAPDRAVARAAAASGMRRPSVPRARARR